MNTSLITKDFNGHSFVFREDGYFNMTKAAQVFGKRLDHFFSNRDTWDYIEALHKLPGITGNIDFVQTQTGRNGGTWAHPKLAVRFARWLDVKFEVWCDSVIEDILSKKAELVVTKPEESATVATTQALGANNGMVKALAMFMEASAQEMAAVKAQVANVTQQVQFTNDQLSIAEFLSQHNIRIHKDCHNKIRVRLTNLVKAAGLPIRKRKEPGLGGAQIVTNTFYCSDLVKLWKLHRKDPAFAECIHTDTKVF